MRTNNGRLIPVHPFPARMASSIAFSELTMSSGKLRVLDPMMGSGTTLAVAKMQGHFAVGFDRDPLAVMMTRAWNIPKKAHARILARASKLVERVRSQYADLGADDAFPTTADDETRAFIRYWFDARNRKQLKLLAGYIRLTRYRATRDALWCAFSRMIVTKEAMVTLARDASHSRPHRVADRAASTVCAEFEKAVRAVLRGGVSGLGKMRSRLGDARRLPLPNCSIDRVITSPPYFNAIDYLRGHKLTLVWMGYRVSEIRRLRAETIGSEASRAKPFPERHALFSERFHRHSKSPRFKKLFQRYVNDMDRVLAETARVLVKKGNATFVVANSWVRGAYFDNAGAIVALGKRHGLRLIKRSSRIIADNRRYLPPPAKTTRIGSLANRMRTEVVIRFQKPTLN